MPDFDRLSAHIVARRVMLGYRNRQALADASGISTRTLGDIETGRRDNFDPSTIAALENALGWATGSFAQVLDGYEPTSQASIPEVATDAALTYVLDSDLPDDTKSRLTQILVEDRLAADRGRMDLARSLVDAFLNI